jgi:Fic family protein
LFYNPYFRKSAKKSLPPAPPVAFDKDLLELYGEAMQSLGRLSEVQTQIPDARQFLGVYVAREAIFSSQIENINTTLTQVLDFKSGKSENRDVQEVLNYISALHRGVDLMHNNLPISSRLIRECHKQLLSGTTGEGKMPGQYRKVPVSVGNLVPPPAHYIENLIHDLEAFVHEDSSLLPLIKVGLAHVQFETIHPFLDGNGRIGRLLIVLMMMDTGLISEPVLYPSFYFMKYRSEYYDRLDRVRSKGDYEGWLKYFLRAVNASAEDVVKRAWAVDSLVKDYATRIEMDMGRTRVNANKLLAQLCRTPVMTINNIAELLGTTYNTAQSLTNNFINTGILVQENTSQRNKTFSFRKYLDILEMEFSG